MGYLKAKLLILGGAVCFWAIPKMILAEQVVRRVKAKDRLDGVSKFAEQTGTGGIQATIQKYIGANLDQTTFIYIAMGVAFIVVMGVIVRTMKRKKS